MKRNTLFVAITLIAFAISSCVVHHHTTARHDNGKHKGWYKGKGNQKKGTTVIIVPDNNGKGNNKSNGKGNGNGKGKKK